jgi:type IV secretory pathway VirB4 component
MEKLNDPKLVKGPQKLPPTQQFLDIQEIREGTVILKNGGLRAVLMASSINFDLKSTDEQDAIISYYQSFLNSLDFPIQIIMSSRRVNLKHYLEDLVQKSKEQTNELLHLQMEEYIRFIKGLVSMVDIVNKTFYIVVPFSPIESAKGGPVDKIKELFTGGSGVASREKSANFQVYKDQLWQRVEHIQYGLNGAGIRMVTLNTQELIELYYSFYNPSPIEKLELVPMERMALSGF